MFASRLLNDFETFVGFLKDSRPDLGSSLEFMIAAAL
jgi:hypothetical protein